MTDMNKERESFEAWLPACWSRETFQDDEGESQYRDDWVQGAWMGWIGRASLAASAPAPSGHIKEPYTLAEIKAKIDSNDYSAELMLQHAMLHLDRLAASAGSEPVKRVFLVATGEEHEGEATYQRYDDAPPPLCDSECLYTHPYPPEGAGWRDIATAPKDGTRVVIAEGEKVVRAWYVVVPYREERDTDGRYIDHTDHEEFWMGDDGDVYDEPTHWQPEAPLPAPPASEAKGA